ncbi:hypothetical protein DFR70_12760 [Nocardia tenerifensis]|uniref:DUF8175 domain-containing protein n=1 Tax=Nocardia tenerifensis TaxID=228006 RepID=A0A318KAL4_9NOCA|nr:hypothetical protein [Nocardia tenerifensis]PXX53449.1 hypothetical protein DFR70_12760 [Nocardia tenerifensis]
MKWNAKGFGDLTPDTPGQAPGTTQSTRNRKTPRQILIAGMVLVSIAVTGMLVLNSCEKDDPASAGSGNSVRAPHGPTGVRDGVPIGYSRDHEGAATAAVNTVQALTQAGQGRIAMAAVEAALIARDPGLRLRKWIENGRDRAEDSSVLNIVPAAVSVTGHSESSAHVGVWVMVVSRSQINPQSPMSVNTAWATDTVDLVWEDGDWQVKELSSKTGPEPGELTNITKDSPLGQPLEAGHYSVYIN